MSAARRVLFLISGGDKSERVRELIEEDFPPEKMPAKAVRPSEGELTYLIDADAAARLAKS